MESTKQNMKTDKKDSLSGKQSVSEGEKPEHHLTCDVHIRARGHKSEMETHCPHKDSNMPNSDIHDKK